MSEAKEPTKVGPVQRIMYLTLEEAEAPEATRKTDAEAKVAKVAEWSKEAARAREIGFGIADTAPAPTAPVQEVRASGYVKLDGRATVTVPLSDIEARALGEIDTAMKWLRNGRGRALVRSALASAMELLR